MEEERRGLRQKKSGEGVGAGMRGEEETKNVQKVQNIHEETGLSEDTRQKGE